MQNVLIDRWSDLGTYWALLDYIASTDTRHWYQHSLLRKQLQSLHYLSGRVCWHTRTNRTVIGCCHRIGQMGRWYWLKQTCSNLFPSPCRVSHGLSTQTYSRYRFSIKRWASSCKPSICHPGSEERIWPLGHFSGQTTSYETINPQRTRHFLTFHQASADVCSSGYRGNPPA
jgi:hypothetical protein